MFKTIEQKVLKLIDENQLIYKNDRILIALSGGADSVFLLHFFLKFQRRLGIQFSAFHLNHKIRGKEAKGDEMFCRNLCEKNKVEIFVAEKDVKGYAKKNKLSVEEAGRILRYKELERIADKKLFAKIATAHNASDNAETVLLNLIKGAGLKGLSGIPVQRDKIIRPLLNLTSDEIRYYLKVKKFDYRLDTSNISLDYERNYLRNEIIPKLKERINPKVEQKILSSSRIIRKTRVFFENQIAVIAQSAVKFSKGELKISFKELNELDKSLWGEFFKSVIESKFTIDLSTENLNSLIKIVKNQAGKKLVLSNKVIAIKEREFLSLVLEKPGPKKSFKRTIKINDEAEINGRTLKIEKVNISEIKRLKKRSGEYISADGIKTVFQIRKWKEGDRFCPLGMKGSKKVSDFLIDEKIPSTEKNEQLVLTNSGRIVWVVGLRIDDRFKINSKTKKAIKLIYK
jgi:tRNA(Ile)-lysidine synthase